MILASSTTAAPASMPPVARPLVLILLFSILLCALADLPLSLINLGLASLFIGLIAAIGTIIHILTNLSVIVHRLRVHRCTKDVRDIWELLPPTSKVSSITMDLILAILFVAAFTTTLLVHITHYFGGGSPVSGGNVDSSGGSRHVNGGNGSSGETDPLKGPKAILYADAGLQLLCAILLIALAVVAMSERRKFQQVP